MARAQCIVVREHKILMVKHRENNHEYWCLPGGSIEIGELPSEAALRELQEECNLTGRIIRETSIIKYSQNDISYTYFIDIDNQTPLMGYDPELTQENQILIEVKWMSLKEISERDRCFLWAAGLLGIPGFLEEIKNWKDVISYPCDS